MELLRRSEKYQAHLLLVVDLLNLQQVAESPESSQFHPHYTQLRLNKLFDVLVEHPRLKRVVVKIYLIGLLGGDQLVLRIYFAGK